MQRAAIIAIVVLIALGGFIAFWALQEREPAIPDPIAELERERPPITVPPVVEPEPVEVAELPPPEMPDTAGVYPLVALGGLALIAAAALLRRFGSSLK